MVFSRAQKPAHDIHHWEPVPLAAGIYACSACGVRGRRVMRNRHGQKGKLGRIVMYKRAMIDEDTVPVTVRLSESRRTVE